MRNIIACTIFGIIIITVISLFFAKSIEDDSWICTNTGWVKYGRPDLIKPSVHCGKTEEIIFVENYLRENISDLSPQKEVLGGKFYINKIDWVEDNLGFVEYEDGHILLKASFDYKINTSNQNNDYSLIIENFKIMQ